MPDAALHHDPDIRPRPEPIVLVILDGWGLSAGVSGNAIRQANPLNFIKLWHEHPHGVLRAVSPLDEAAGLTGISNTGHASIGAGRLIHTDASDITAALGSGDFFRAPGMAELIATTQASHATLHVIGLLSRHSSHGRIDHFLGCLELARQQGQTDVVAHVILDDGPAAATARLLTQFRDLVAKEGLGRIGTITGRSFALDRSGQWERTRATYRTLIGRATTRATFDELTARLSDSQLAAGELEPTQLMDSAQPPAPALRTGDTVLVALTRPDRTTQLVHAFSDRSALAWLGAFRQEPLLGLKVWTLVDGHVELPDVRPVFKTAEIPGSLGQILSNHGIPQARIGSPERMPHLGYYLNGGRQSVLDHETRLIATTAQDSAQVARRLIDQQTTPLIVVNLDAVDQTAHTGDFEATLSAVRDVDAALGSIAEQTLAAGGTLIVTADHGNAESLLPSRGAHHHTASGVPWIVATADNRRPTNVVPARLAFPTGLPDHQHSLADIAPTILGLLGIAKPSTMTGRSLI